MLYITSLVLIDLISLYLLTAFIQSPLFPSPASGNHKSDLFFYVCCFFARFWSIIDLQHYVSFCYITVIWYVYTCQTGHHNKSSYGYVTLQRYYIVINCIPHTVHFLPMSHLFCKWKFVPLNLPHLFISSPYFPSLWQTPVCSLYL